MVIILFNVVNNVVILFSCMLLLLLLLLFSYHCCHYYLLFLLIQFRWYLTFFSRWIKKRRGHRFDCFRTLFQSYLSFQPPNIGIEHPISLILSISYPTIAWVSWIYSMILSSLLIIRDLLWRENLKKKVFTHLFSWPLSLFSLRIILLLSFRLQVMN